MHFEIVTKIGDSSERGMTFTGQGTAIQNRIASNCTPIQFRPLIWRASKVLLVDMFVLWFFLNAFSDENWDDQPRINFGIALALVFLLRLTNKMLIEQIGAILTLAAHFLVGTVCMWGLASLEFKKALGAMGIYVAYKLIVSIAILMIFGA